MRVLNLSLDSKVFENESLVQKRLIALAEKVGEIMVLVPGERDEERKVSPHLTVYGISGSKAIQFFKMWKVGNTILDDTTPLNPPSKEVGREKRIKKEGRKPYDLITVQDTYFLALLGYFLSRRFNIPFEVQVHGLEKFYGMRKWIAGFVLRRADRIRVVSERLKRELDSRFPPAPRLRRAGRTHDSRIYELPVYTQMTTTGASECAAHFIKWDTTPVPHFSEKVGDTPFIKGDKNEFTFLTVGRLVPVKNIALQIRAFARLEKEFPNARLRIVGDGPMRSNLQLTIYNLQLGDNVIFGGRQSELERFYQEADAFLLTSDREGWGVAVTEAAYFGLPIIMTDVGLAGEFVKNEENGIVIPVGDENALVEAMKRVIEDADLRARLGAAARRSFLALPNADEQIRKQIEEWKKLRNR